MSKGLLKTETDQYMKVMDVDKEDKLKFSKIAGPGDELRKMASASHLNNPEEMRKNLRKKKSAKSKSKRKSKKKECGCK